MKTFNTTFTCTIEVRRTYQAYDKSEAENLAKMDAEDGQIGSFPHEVIEYDVTDVSEAT